MVRDHSKRYQVAASTVTKVHPGDLEPEYTFADVVYALTNRTPGPQEWAPGMRIYTWAALLAYSLSHPMQFLQWVDEETDFSETLRVARCAETQDRWWTEAKQQVTHCATLSKLFLLSPLSSPEDHARQAWNGTLPPRSRRMRSWTAGGRPKEGTVRVKWYPSVEAMRCWPEEFGELWVDLPLEPDGGLDLRPAMRLWGMENCYVLDGNRDEPHLHARRPTEDLTALGVRVLLGEYHEVIGIVEKPTPIMQEARRARVRMQETLKATPYLLEKQFVSIAQAVKDGFRATPNFLRDVLITIFVLFSMTIVDSIVLFVSKVLWPAFVNKGLPVIGMILQVVLVPFVMLARAARMARPWVAAAMEAVFLSEEDLEDWNRTRRRATRPGTISEDSEEADENEYVYEDGRV